MRAYRWLLRLCPASFRNEYGSEMTAAFADRLRDAGHPLARLLLCFGRTGELDDGPRG